LPRLKLAFAKAGHEKPARDGRFFFEQSADREGLYRPPGQRYKKA